FVYTNETGAVLDAGTVLSAGNHALTATFTLTDPTDYTLDGTNGGIIPNSITVNQATPTITWTNPADISRGTKLSDTQLDASSSVPGTFAYNPIKGTTMDNAGMNQPLSVTFTPDDSTDYKTATVNCYFNTK